MTNHNDELIWYVSYGSNMLYERFMCYIKGGTCRFNGFPYTGCHDKTLPHGVKMTIIPYELYFGNISKKWKYGGVAFIDINKPGKTIGKMYLIKRGQLNEVHKKEGKSEEWYDRLFSLGEYDGYEMFTITSSNRKKEYKPCKIYSQVMEMGINEGIDIDELKNK